MKPNEEVLAWLTEFVLAHGLCPFAARPWKEGRVGAEHVMAEDIEALFYAALSRVQRFVDKAPEELETTLLVMPKLLNDFDTFLDFVYTFEEALAETGADELVQLAHFHPNYKFEGVAEDDPGNLTNRSPYPVIQLLRVGSVAAAVAGYADVAGIPARNVALMRSVYGGHK